MSAVVSAKGWGYRHAGRQTWAVRNLDLTVEHGERILLAGQSGAGKSTLLSALAGLLDTEHSGTSEGRLEALERADVGMVFQDPETQLVMARAGDDVAFGLENHAVPTNAIWPRVDEALSLVGFPYGRDRATGRLSGGEKQRLVLAGVFALRPTLLLLDEPTANLDPDGAALVRQTVARAVGETGATLIVVEHRVSDWLDLVDRVVVLQPGDGVLADGPPTKVFAHDGESLADAGVWVPDLPLPSARATTEPSRPALVGTDLSYVYPGASRPAIDGISVDLHIGETLAVTGPNGSGKSTLALVLAGLLAPTTGSVRAVRGDGSARHDRPLHRWRPKDLVSAVGTVFQDPEHQFLTSTVRAELALGPRLTGAAPDTIERRVDELLTRLRLRDLAEANPFTLSGGEKRRLSVATALVSEPETLILDEPTFGQDRRTWIELLELLSSLRDAGHAICCVSHDEAFVDALADRRLDLATEPSDHSEGHRS